MSMSGETWEARKAQSPCVGLSSHSSLASHGTGGGPPRHRGGKWSYDACCHEGRLL